MLAPQFSLRRLLALATASALVCLIFAIGLRGQLWAVALSVAIVGLATSLVVFALLYGIVGGIALALTRQGRPGAAGVAGKSSDARGSPLSPDLP